MYSVIIVDDEEPVLESYEFMLNTFSKDEGKKSPFTLAGKARTGVEALRLINELKPDLVFMDINIPGIDGLTVLEDVCKKYPNMICILSTAYERFDLARRAIPLGAFAYLVKPVSKNTVFSTLEKALIKLRSLSPEKSEYNEPRLTLFRRDIWSAMDEQRWSWYRETLVLPSDYGFVLMVELKQKPQSAGTEGSVQHELSPLMESRGIRIAEQLSYKYHCTFDVQLNRGFFLISENVNPELLRQKIVRLLEKQLTAITWHFGLGGCYRGPELYHSCSEALAELAVKLQGTDAWSAVGKKIAVLRQKIGLLTLEETKLIFAAVWEPLFYGDFSNAKLRMVSLFTLLLDDLYDCWSVPSRRGISNSSPVLPFDPAEIMELPDMDAWKRWVDHNFDKLIIQANLERQGNYPLPLVKALSFVRENYIRSIQLGDAARAAQVDTAYLSRLFSKHLKTNFIEYLTALRINEAERLLKEKSISVKEAAAAAGYQDPNYFSKIFKKTKGILPTEVNREQGTGSGE